MTKLEEFIIAAKAATYAGDGSVVPSCRPGSNDLAHVDGEWQYRDSYFGGTDFLGQEVVWHIGKPIWAMNYYGYITRPDLMDAEKAGAIIRKALSQLYADGRFLGGHICEISGFRYVDDVTGTHEHFHGIEQIHLNEIVVYELRYHGGLLRK